MTFHAKKLLHAASVLLWYVTLRLSGHLLDTCPVDDVQVFPARAGAFEGLVSSSATGGWLIGDPEA